jgi:hypothetical protein
LFGKEKKPLRWLVFPAENLFFGKTQKSFLLGLLFFDVPFFVFNESCGKNYHTPNGWRLGEGGDFTTKLSYEAHTSNLR